MAKEKKNIEKKVANKDSHDSKKTICNDKLCPTHGDEKVRVRGRVFEGKVIRKHHGRVTIQFERVLYVPKYERYEKRRTKLHARLMDCMKDDVDLGDYIQIGETRPISKTIHFVVVKVVRKRPEEKVKIEEIVEKKKGEKKK